jgi:hypothetical protein
MKIRYIIGSVMIASFIGLFLFFPKNETVQGSYDEKELSSIIKPNANEALEWINARYLDEETGERITTEKLASIEQDLRRLPRTKSMSFYSQGPDNIGGRTRAICVDRTWNDKLWAGGVSGGLFASYDGADTWGRVSSFIEQGASPNISSITQTLDGTLYVATGSDNEGWNGNGVWYSQNSGDTWTKIPGTSNCTEIVSSDVEDKVWLATNSGLRTWELGETSLTNISVTTGVCKAVKISSDAQVIVASFQSNKTYVSTNGGDSFEDRSGSANNDLVPAGANRIEYAVSKEKNNDEMYSLYAVRTNSNLLSMHVSHNNGEVWTQFVGASGPPNEFDIYRNQGTYNSIVSVNPTNPESIYIGGIDVWRWNQTVNNPPSGGFEKVSQWFVNPTTPIYVHADNHEMQWDANNRLYVGNDGGIGVTEDYGQNWYPANRGYNVTQFYGIAFDKSGAVMGGTQDNGTLYNDHKGNTFQEFTEVGGGDGFECEISHFNPRVMFTSVYYTSISRSGDGGESFTGFSPELPGNYDPPGSEGSSYHPFHTEFVLAEYYDTNSEDSIQFSPTLNYSIGDEIMVPSLSSGDTISYIAESDYYFDDTLYYDPTLTVNGTNYVINSVTGETLGIGTDTLTFNVTWDTVKVQDPYQSWFLVFVNANGGELWGTRNALRFSEDPNWVCVARGIGSGNVDIEFSRDLENCYINVGNGGVWRVDGLGSAYTSDTLFNEKVSYDIVAGIPTTPTYTTATKISNSSPSGIALNPNNADDLIMFAGFSGSNKRTSNATAAVPTFTNLQSISSPQVASYDGIIDRNDPNIIVVGTSSGVFVTEDGGSNWTNASAGFEGTPVYEVRQSWRTFEEGNGRPGEIYAGTYGRGIWASDNYLSVEEPSIVGSSNNDNMLLYPNPSVSECNVIFDLSKNGDINIGVYNLSGRLMLNKEYKNRVSGGQNIELNIDSLSRGTYIIQMTSGSQKLTKKLLKL